MSAIDIVKVFEFDDDSILEKSQNLFLDSKIKHFYYVTNKKYNFPLCNLHINNNILLFSSNYAFEKFIERNIEINQNFEEDIDLRNLSIVKIRKMRDLYNIIKSYSGIILGDNLIIKRIKELPTDCPFIKGCTYKVSLYKKKTEEESNIL